MLQGIALLLEGPNSSIARYYRNLLRSCARHTAHNVGQKLHAAAITTGLIVSENSFLRNAVLHMYAACGDLLSAKNTFDEISHHRKDTVDWTTLMGCYTRTGSHLQALKQFILMRKNQISIDDITIIYVFNCCGKLSDEKFGVQVHSCVIKMGFYSSVKACNSAINMYVKCGLMHEAKWVFDEMSERSIVSWTVILEGAVNLEGLEEGRLVFDEMPERNEVAWTMMITCYIKNGLVREAFGLLKEMVFDYELGLNFVTLCSLLSACAQSGDVMLGMWLHTYAVKVTGKQMDVMVGTALIDMYAKCGRINSAIRVFGVMERRNVITFNAMLSGLAMHGNGRVVLEMFSQMVKEVKPDDVTFTAVLSACSHSGLVDQGRRIFHDLERLYGIRPSMEHYSCVVDLLGRAGHLEEAEAIIRRMPMEPNEVVLGSLLGSCSVHRKLELGKRFMSELIQLYPNNTEYHILLSNMYALSGKRENADSLRRILKNRGITKIPGMSSIHINGQFHQFVAGDKLHPQTQEIYAMLDEMIQKLRLSGYVPNTASQVLFCCDGGEDPADVQEEKEQALFTHSEKLAVSFGLISTRPGKPLCIFKNLRICQDCHTAMKLVSKIYDRQIVIRDRNRFHCFKQGSCSCCDYW